MATLAPQRARLEQYVQVPPYDSQFVKGLFKRPFLFVDEGENPYPEGTVSFAGLHHGRGPKPQFRVQGSSIEAQEVVI